MELCLCWLIPCCNLLCDLNQPISLPTYMAFATQTHTHTFYCWQVPCRLANWENRNSVNFELDTYTHTFLGSFPFRSTCKSIVWLCNGTYSVPCSAMVCHHLTCYDPQKQRVQPNDNHQTSTLQRLTADTPTLIKPAKRSINDGARMTTQIFLAE